MGQLPYNPPFLYFKIFFQNQEQDLKLDLSHLLTVKHYAFGFMFKISGLTFFSSFCRLTIFFSLKFNQKRTEKLTKKLLF